MSVSYINASHLDASAAVKLVVSERGSDYLAEYFADGAGFFITSLCLAEALGVLKRKMLQCELSQDQYFDRCYFLLAYIRDNRIQVDDVQISSFETFEKAEEIARRYKLDLSDSLQLVSVKHGRFHSFVKESKTVFITADRALVSAARAEGLRAWNCEREAKPPPQ